MVGSRSTKTAAEPTVGAGWGVDNEITSLRVAAKRAEEISMTTAAVPTETMDYSREPAKRTMKLWPGVLIVVAMWVGSRLPGWVAPVTMWQFFGYFYGPVVALVALAIWWLSASRLPWSQRLLIPAVVIAGGVVLMAL